LSLIEISNNCVNFESICILNCEKITKNRLIAISKTCLKLKKIHSNLNFNI
jgi:hypothetical protein